MKYYECAFSLSYPACNAHTPHSHLWPALLYNIFPHYPMNRTVFGGWALNIKRVFWFSLQLLSEAFLILRTVRDITINDICLHVKYPLFLSDFNKTLNFLTDLKKKKYSNAKFHGKPSSGSWVVAFVRTDGQNEANSWFFIILQKHLKITVWKSQDLRPVRKFGQIWFCCH